MSVPRQQPAAIAKFKHKQRTSTVAPAMVRRGNKRTIFEVAPYWVGVFKLGGVNWKADTDKYNRDYEWN